MIPGIKVPLGGEDYILPALSLRGVRDCEEDLDFIQQKVDDSGGAFSEERFAAICRVVHTALIRNYPKVKLDEMRDLVDLNSLPILIDAVLGLSGLEKVMGESAPGE